MSGWQPIETAPRDQSDIFENGTEFLAYDPASGKIAVCKMVRSRDMFWKWHWHLSAIEGDGDHPLSNGFRQTHATHWMPLPKPPVHSAAETD